MNEEEKKAICELKQYITKRKKVYTKLDRHDKAINNLLNLIKKLYKENKEYKEYYEVDERIIHNLQKENEELKERIREHTLLISPYYVKENYIPVQKVKDKIEELKKDETNKYYYMFLEDRDLENTIQVLQELLEK